MKHFTDWNIDKKIVSIFAGGFSKDKLDKKELSYIKDKTYVIGLNEFVNIEPHCRFWSDPDISQIMYQRYEGVTDKPLFVCTKSAILRNFIPDFYFDRFIDKINYKFSITSVLQILRRISDCTILLFGVDCYETDERKTINETIETREGYREILYDIRGCIETMFNNNEIDFKNIWNCNMDSFVNIPKIKYNNII